MATAKQVIHGDPRNHFPKYLLVTWIACVMAYGCPLSRNLGAICDTVRGQ